jgi:GTP-binding protein EngB required for normal cell division
MSEARLTPKAKPRIAIMGEFSAGKSTLCNLLLKAGPLPEKVTATRLSPVWMTKGPGQHMRILLDGTEEPVSIDQFDQIPVEDTRYIRLFMEADLLDHCDLIDFPGISDPNMDAEVWERVLVEADAVIWLTHATQAWRQTEAAVWDTVPEEVQENSILLITRFDKLITEKDRSRVLARMQREAGLYFDKVFPISLLNALEAGDDFEKWQASGADAFLEHMAQMVVRLGTERSDVASDAEPAPAPVTLKVVEDEPEAVPSDEASEDEGPKIMPRRVKPMGLGRRRLG